MHRVITKRALSTGWAIVGAIAAITLLWSFQLVFAENSEVASEEHLITIHDRGEEQSVITREKTVKAALEQAQIDVDEIDQVEPALNTELVAKSYHINIYRARPVLVEDGLKKIKVLTAKQSPKAIAAEAGLTLYDEDIATQQRVEDIVTAEGAGLRLIIDRAVPFSFNLYGETFTARTQATTVGEMLKEKSVKLGPNDGVSPGASTPIRAGMKVNVWRNGKQTITVKESIKMPVEEVQDHDREVGYRKVKTPGAPGAQRVTYEIVMKNGREVSRKKIAAVVTKEAVTQVEIVGAKPSFSGDFAAALAKLRSCEGGYDSWNPAGPYYGAYQFDRQTWGTVADPALYGRATPGQQDAAAHQLYLRRGWSPWPVCGAGLPDSYR